MVDVSLNPVDVITMITAHYKNRDKAVEELLTAVAQEARVIADTWGQVAAGLTSGALSRSKAQRLRDQLAAASKTPNAPHFARLREFYHIISSGVRGLSSTDQELALTHIGQLIIDRDVTSATYERAMQADRPSVFVDPTNTIIMLRDMRASVDALHREAAALEVMAKTYRLRT